MSTGDRGHRRPHLLRSPGADDGAEDDFDDDESLPGEDTATAREDSTACGSEVRNGRGPVSNDPNRITTIDSSDEDLEWEDGHEKRIPPLRLEQNGRDLLVVDVPRARGVSLGAGSGHIGGPHRPIAIASQKLPDGNVVPAVLNCIDEAKDDFDHDSTPKRQRRSLASLQASALLAFGNSVDSSDGIDGASAAVEMASFQGRSEMPGEPISVEEGISASRKDDAELKDTAVEGAENDRVVRSECDNEADIKHPGRQHEKTPVCIALEMEDNKIEVPEDLSSSTARQPSVPLVPDPLLGESQCEGKASNCSGERREKVSLGLQGNRFAGASIEGVTRPGDAVAADSHQPSVKRRPEEGLLEGINLKHGHYAQGTDVDHNRASAIPVTYSDLEAENENRPRHVELNPFVVGQTESVSEEMFGETRDLLRLLGLPYLEAPMEAEAQCAYLNDAGVVDAVITEDSDAFLFGAKTVYRNLFMDGKFAETYDVACIESELGIDRKQLIKLALLLGSDYTEGVRGVGIVNSMEILEAFPGEDGLAEFKEWVQSVTLFQDNELEEREMQGLSAEAVRRRFCWKHRNMKRNWEVPNSFPNPAVADAYWHPDVDKSTSPFSWKSIDVEGLRIFCWDKFGWNLEKFTQVTGPVLKQVQNVSQLDRGPRQSAIDDFFKPHRFAKIRSERLKLAIKGVAGDRSAALMAEQCEEQQAAGKKRRRRSRADE
jgi:5'-3' exonuclease